VSPRFLRAHALGGAFLFTLAVSQSALAFCRTTTCDPNSDPCQADANGCETTGLPLAWTTPCVSFGVQKDGSAKRNISYDAAHAVIEDAFARWSAASCDGGGHPSLEIADLGAITCSEPEYNTNNPNANVWLFDDEDWPYAEKSVGGGPVSAAALAVTAVTYNPETGAIYDADVEINSENVPLTLSAEMPQYDLSAIVMHEAGHFLGLSHSSTHPEATMYDVYSFGDIEMRSLSADDEAGICAVYPPNRETPPGDCTPRHGFSSDCAPPPDEGCCSTAPGRATPDSRGAWLFAFASALTGGLAWRRRARNAVI
jgi:hypothetical protein